MPIGYPGNSITKEARAKAGGGFESAIENAAPGALVNGQPVTLSQGNYGPAPTIVGASNFENLADGADVTGLATDAGYKTSLSKQGIIPITGDTTRKHSGTRSVKVEWLRDPADGGGLGGFGWTGMNANTDHLRISYWRYQNLVFDTSVFEANIKQFYIFGTGAGEIPQALMLNPAGQNHWNIYNNVGANSEVYNSLVTNSQGKWEHWDFYFYAGSGLNSLDGIYEVRQDGWLQNAKYDYKFQEGAAGSWDDVRIGHMAGGARDSQVWYDEFQVTSGGPQAIFVSDAAVFDDGLKHNVASQYHASWTDNEITFNLNASALPTATPLYCHVVKSDRTVVTHSIGEL